MLYIHNSPLNFIVYNIPTVHISSPNEEVQYQYRESKQLVQTLKVNYFALECNEFCR